MGQKMSALNSYEKDLTLNILIRAKN